jgi:P pilus assembly chaperone PapD
MPQRRTLITSAIAAFAAILSSGVAAQGFAAVVSPPRFELSAKPGERLREVVEITNASAMPANYKMRTADWTLGSDASVSFSDALAPGSCRPWVAIERRDIAVPGGGRYRYRFEVEPPSDAPPGECRFALMIEGEEQLVRAPSGLSVPVSGRIGVIVYVRVGSAAPDLEIVGSSVEEVDAKRLPVLRVRNTGNAHGRLGGFLSGVDAKGRSLEFTPSTLPILPGETRAISLAATDGTTEVADIAYPVRVKGTLEWGDGKRVELDQQFAR